MDLLSNSFSGNLSFRQKEYLGRDDLISKDFSQMNFLYEKKAACEGVFKNGFPKFKPARIKRRDRERDGERATERKRETKRERDRERKKEKRIYEAIGFRVRVKFRVRVRVGFRVSFGFRD